MATSKNIKKLNYINNKILKTISGLVPGDTFCIDSQTTGNLDYRFIKLIESDDKYYFVPCDQEGLLLIDSLSNEVSLDKWSTKDLKELFN